MAKFMSSHTSPAGAMTQSRFVPFWSDARAPGLTPGFQGSCNDPLAQGDPFAGRIDRVEVVKTYCP